MLNYVYDAEAVALQGSFGAPYNETIPTQGKVLLDPGGGVRSVPVGPFRHRQLVSFDAAHSEVIGRYSEKTHSFEALMYTVIEGLNVMGVITADRVVARLVSTHPDDPNEAEPSITPIGSSFVNLKIAGVPVNPVLSSNIFSGNQGKFSTLAGDPGAREALTRCWSEETRSRATPRVREHLPVEPQGGIGATEPIRASLVQDLGAGSLTLPHAGNVIEVPGFGIIRLAEFEIRKRKKRVTMLRVTFGSPVEGELTAGDTSGDGNPT